jgi:elongation factor 1-beta
MGMAIIKMRVMPTSPNVNLAELEQKLNDKVLSLGEKVHSFEKEPIAFGLVALNMIVGWPETKDQSVLENAVKEIEEIESSEIIDFRREFG